MSYRIDADSVDEADEAVVLEVFSATNASLAGDAPVLRSTGWVLDDDGTGNNLALFVLGPDVKENLPGGAVASFDISLSRPAPRDLEFAFTTSNGTAEAGADYVATSGTIRFTEGQTRTAVNVPIIGDTLSEPDETFTLKVMPTGDLANGEAGTEGTATVVDNGPVMPPPELSIADGPDQAEGNAGTTLFSFTVTRSGDLSGASSADWSVAGVGADPAGAADFGGTLPGGTVSFAAGEAEAVITVEVSGDADLEPDEDFVVTLSGAAGATIADGEGTATILNDDGTAFVEIEGTEGIDYLVGGDAAEILKANGGPLDQLRGGGNGDIFEFTNTERIRDVVRVLDYSSQDGDLLDLGGADFDARAVGSSTYLLLEGEDRDMVIVDGVADVDELLFA